MTVVPLDNPAHLDFRVRQVTQDPQEMRVQLLLLDYPATLVQLDPLDNQVHRDLLVLQDPVEPLVTTANRVIPDFLDQKGKQGLQAVLDFLEM